MKVLYFSVVVLLFTSCVNIKEVFSKDYLYESILENTQKAELVESLEIKTLVTATYLNPIKLDVDKSYENFLVSMFIANDFKKQYALKNPFVKISLNEDSSKSIKELKKDSKLLKTISVLNPWAKYFLVTFKAQKSKDLNLSFTYKNLSSLLKFSK